MIYSSRINIKTLEWEKHKTNYPDADAVEGAAYNEDGWEDIIYAESGKSQKDADRMVLELAIELRDRFDSVAKHIKKEMFK